MSYIILIRRPLSFFLLLLHIVAITVACSSQNVSFPEGQVIVTGTPITSAMEQPVTPTGSTSATVITYEGLSKEMYLGYGTFASAALNPNKDQLAILTTQRLWLFDVNTMEVLRVFDKVSEIDIAGSVVWSPDGNQLILWYDHYHSWTASIIHRETGQEIRFLGGDTLNANIPSWSPDNLRIAFPSRDSLVRVWDLEQGGELVALDAQVESNSPVVWSPDGKLLATGGTGFVTVWDSDNWRKQYEFEYDLGGPGFNWIGDLAWSPDGKLLAGIAGSSSDKWIWNFVEKTSHQLPHLGTVPDALTWSADGSSLIFAGERGVKILNVTEEREVSTLETSIFRTGELEWLPDKSHLYVAGLVTMESYQIQLWDVESGQLIQKVEIPLNE